MFKLSKESKITFTGLLIVPLICIVINYGGYFDLMEYKSVDLRFTARGDISHRSSANADEPIAVEGNKTVPRIPKVMYVNFDTKTLSRDEVGERPWYRDTFREVGEILLEEGQARTLKFDFIFSPKSTSRMVEERKVYESDLEIARLISKFPRQVVCATAFTSVQTPYLKNEFIDIKASMPQLKKGYDPLKMGFYYPESPTYPIFTYKDGEYVGLDGNILVGPSPVDGLQREVQLWSPGGGKAHAYNVLGGKMAKLGLEGVDANGTKQATLVEVGDELHLVWMDSNNTLVDSLPNRMPLVRNRNSYIIGAEVMMSYFGVDENSVEMTEGNKRFRIKNLAGEVMIDAPMTEAQDMEINWFAKWQRETNHTTLRDEAEEAFIAGNLEKYLQLVLPLIRSNLKLIEGLEVPEVDDDLPDLLREMQMEEKNITVVEELIQATKGRIAPDEAPDFVELRSVVDEIGKEYLPPRLFDPFNPMCEMHDVLVYKEYLEDRRKELKSIDKTSIPLVHSNIQKIRTLLYRNIRDQGMREKWETLAALDERVPNLEKAFALNNLSLIENQLKQSREERSKMLKEIEEYEEASFPKDGNMSIVASKSDADQARERFVSLGKELNDIGKRIDDENLAIANLRNSIEENQNPAVATILQTQLDKKLELSTNLVPDLVEKAIDCVRVLKNLAAFNERERNDIEAEIKQYQTFFDQFKDAIVLIGPTEFVFQDIAPTPIDKRVVPKVSLHGNVIKTLSSGVYLKRPLDGNLSVSLLILAISSVLGYLSVNSATWSSWVGAIILLAFIAVAFFLFAKQHIVIPVAAPATAGGLTFFLGLIVMMVVEQKAKGRLKGMFGSYVSAELVDQMVDSGEEPHLGGEETAITAFFSDVQAFSSFSELLTPTGLVDLMNEYLTAMTDILQEERGTLDKYIGDAIVAMYGAPIPMEDHAYQSVRTALRMQEKQLELRDKWDKEEEKWGKCYGLVKKMQTRIGCNTGTATVGNMGALDRFNYTMMGDMVNLAARCESGAKAYGAYIMITEETKQAAEKLKDDIAYRYLDKIVVKGRSQPVSMYEPTGFMADLKQETQDCLDCFRQGIDKYLLQDWDGALNMFEKAKELEPNKPGVTPGVKDNPSMILIDRCQIMKENPPGDDWDGVYVMTSK
jgi:class 3 adenylate cyclase